MNPAQATEDSICLHCQEYGLSPGSTVCVECGADVSDPLCGDCDDSGRVSTLYGDVETESFCDCGRGEVLRERAAEDQIAAWEMSRKEVA
jgi:hypothetical protein